MDLSIIIVNYNVRHFLEQCLRSVEKASAGLQVEVIVVDNNSTDGSQEMLKEKFGQAFTLIENQENTGFSCANNQGIAIAKGKYVLLLNPDTLVEEQTFRSCYEFMEAHPEAGALGVKMVDGQGGFLPESKRGLPTPWVSFYKIFGLAKMFPRSKTFGRYHLSYLDKDETHEVEVLSGAYMWLRKSVLEEIGGLDEAFFMYGEDIDLSYRVIQAGYKNYYFAGTRILHYKGESTKKGSLNYVKVFYQAMIIFARKHFGGGSQRRFIFFIRLAVYFRAFLAVLSRLVRKLGFPLLEAGLVYGIIFSIKEYWEHYVKYVEGGHYPVTFDTVAAPIYTLVFISFLWVAGAYKKPFRLPPLVMATFWGFVAIATVSFVYPKINFSRAIVGLSSIFTLLMAISTRGLINLREKGNFFFSEPHLRRVVLLGDGEGVDRLARLIRQELDYPVEIIGAVTPAGTTRHPVSTEVLGSLDQIGEVLRLYRVAELVFDNGSLSTHRILGIMEGVQAQELEYKILPPGADFLVGPQTIYSPHQIRYNLQQSAVRLRKNVFDVISSSLLLLSFPLLFWLYRRPLKVPGCLLRVLSRRSHMVGYIQSESPPLPPLKPGLLDMRYRAGRPGETHLSASGLDRFYARTYTWELDLEILVKGWRRLGE